jgi:hypothetical protein
MPNALVSDLRFALRQHLNRVSTNYFDVLGVQLMMGRNLRLFVADVPRDADRSGPGAAGRVGVAVRDRRAGRRLESVIASLVTGCIY